MEIFWKHSDEATFLFEGVDVLHQSVREEPFPVQALPRVFEHLDVLWLEGKPLIHHQEWPTDAASIGVDVEFLFKG